MTIEQIAEVCHGVNRVFCISIGDNSQPRWNQAPDWQKKSAVAGVQFRLDRPESKPSASHESWLEEKRKDGWKYGPVKDPIKKEHPCFIPYEGLPKEQQSKDYIFQAVVDELKKYLTV